MPLKLSQSESFQAGPAVTLSVRIVAGAPYGELARTFQSKAVGEIHAGQEVVRRYVGALVGRFTVEYLDLVDEQPGSTGN